MQNHFLVHVNVTCRRFMRDGEDWYGAAGTFAAWTMAADRSGLKEPKWRVLQQEASRLVCLADLRAGRAPDKHASVDVLAQESFKKILALFND